MTTDWPRGWRAAPLWSLFERVKDTDHPTEQMLSVYRDFGVVPKEGRSDNLNKTAENRSIYQLVHPGWLVVNRMKAFQGSVGISEHRGIVSGHYLCFRPRHEEDPNFLNLLLRSAPYIHEYRRMSRGVRPNQVEIDNDELRVLPLYLPPLSVQRDIAAMIGRETAKIDALIAKQDALVARLGEHRRAMVAGAVEAVLEASSGARFKHFVTEMRQGWSPQCESVPADGVTEWGVLKTGCVNGGVFRPEENKLLPADVEPRVETVVRRGEIVMSRASTRDLVGSAAVVEAEYPRLMLSDKTYAITVDRRVADPWFVSSFLGTPRLRQAIELEATGASQSMQNVSKEDLLNLPMPLPPVAAQVEVARALLVDAPKVDAMVGKAEQLSAKLKERRAALITAAVTGTLDVTTYGKAG